MRTWVGRAASTAAGLSACAAAALLLVGYGPTLFGYESLVVTGGSMGKAMPVGAAAITRLVDARAIASGDVISFRRLGRADVVTHRVVSVAQRNGDPAFTTKGDANATADPEPVIAPERIHRVEYVVPFAGTLVRFGRSPAGWALFFVLPVAGLTIERRRRDGGRRRAAAPAAAGWSSAPAAAQAEAGPPPVPAIDLTEVDADRWVSDMIGRVLHAQAAWSARAGA